MLVSKVGGELELRLNPSLSLSLSLSPNDLMRGEKKLVTISFMFCWERSKFGSTKQIKGFLLR